MKNGKYTKYSRIFHTFAWVKISRRISLSHYAVLPKKCHCTQKHIRAMTFLLCCFQIRILVFSQSSRSRYRVNTMLDRVQVSGYAQEIMPNWGMNFRMTVT